MVQRFSFWLGLLLGGGTAFGTRRRWLPAPRLPRPDPLLDLVGDAVIACDAAGAISYANAAARQWFGPDADGIHQLSYPSGQPVPPGQLPLTRALRTGQSVVGAGYVFLTTEGTRRVLDVDARPISGGAICVFHDVTARQEAETRERETAQRGQVLRALCQCLSAATDAEEIARGTVENALALLDGLAGARVRLYAYDSERKRLTRLASAPDARPKRPRSHRQAQPPTFPFDATSPLLWQVYIAREPFVSHDHSSDLGEAESEGATCAFPLLAGGRALGHLSVTCPAANAFGSADLMEALTQIAALAAPSLASLQQAAEAAHLAKQSAALREIALTVTQEQSHDGLADFVAKQVKSTLECEICTLAVQEDNGLRLVGADYQEALLFPTRHAPNDPALIGSAAQEAVRTGKTVLYPARPNRTLDAGLWRAFAGQSGHHSVVSVPLRAGQGALTVYAAGEAPFSKAQISFLETVAAMLSATRTSF